MKTPENTPLPSPQAHRDDPLTRRSWTIPWKTLFLLYFVFLALVIFAPQSAVEHLSTPMVRQWNKLIHLILFIPFGCLGTPALSRSIRHIGRFRALAICAVTAILMEYLQGVLPVSRQGYNLMDAVANASGSILGSWLFMLGAHCCGRSRQE